MRPLVTHNSPRISATKLAEYMTATFARKRSILQNQKYPAPYMLGGWRDASRDISRFAASGFSDISILDRAAERIEGSDFSHKDSLLEAIQGAKGLANSLEFRKFEIVLGSESAPPLEVGGVSVFVTPNVLLLDRSASGNDDAFVGGGEV